MCVGPPIKTESPEVLTIRSSDMPSPYSDHIIIEPADSGRFRANGVSKIDRGLPAYLMTPAFSSLEDAIVVAMKWAIENALSKIYVLATD